MAGTAVTKLLEFPSNSGLEDMRLAVNASVDGDEAIRSRLSRYAVTTAGLVITATAGKKVPKTGAAIYYGMVEGVMVQIATGTDMPALVGSVTNAKFNVFVFGIGADAVVNVQMGTEAATLAAVVWPAFAVASAPVGAIIIHPTGTGPFVGNTTALDDGTVVPNTIYLSPTGPVFHQGVALAASLTNYKINRLE